ncbi:MAG: CoA pyrophosphatase [Crocinitomicaceae bacterium]|nr:CoA pyrophosphatase [Crocinitomicaceae bacterium]
MKRAIDYRKSAVGIVLFEEANSIRCVLIQRPQYEGTHGGQVSFPGGKMDATDVDLEYTAKRECMEEIDLEPSLMRTVGRLSEVYIPVSKFLVQPYIFFVDPLPSLKPDEREVDEIFTFEIDNLLNSTRLKRIDLKFKNGFKQKDIPYFDIEGRVVWGATAMILSEFKAILKSL